MPRVLRADRYLTANNASLARFITDELWDLDLDETLSFYRTLKTCRDAADLALLACNDRYFLLTGLCGRKDAINDWVFTRCREVESDPDGYLDLWARYHYKSSIITFAGVLQETLIDPELTVAIFSFNKRTAKAFLAQHKRELESNEYLKTIFKDVLYQDPRNESPKWSEEEGLVFRRKGNPKEATIEAHGVIDAMPTGKHFGLLDFDDLIERGSVTNPEMIKKATEGWELAQNLGIGEKTRLWHAGTRYLFGDTYSIILERKILKERIYPATHNGRLEGKPVFFSQAHWDDVKKKQRSTVAAQMLQNPVAGKEGTFELKWFRPYEVLPHSLNVYIMGDPSKGRTARSDRTAIAVIGIDAQNNKYLLDGARHRMNQSQRWDMLKMLYVKWKERPGVQMVKVGWEAYGMQTDDEYFREKQKLEKNQQAMFVIEELAWPREGKHSKEDRISRLQPDFEGSKFYLPWYVYHEGLGECSWRVDDDGNKINYNPASVAQAPRKDAHGNPIPNIGDKWLTKLQRANIVYGKAWLVPEAIKRKDEDDNVYDVTRALFEEMSFHPFGTKDDLVDAVSRIYDMEPSPAVSIEQTTPEVIEYPDA
jgi:hypothetical protein